MSEHAMLLDGGVPVDTALRAGAPLDVAGLAEPRVGAHLAVILGTSLHGHMPAARALLAVEAVCGALVVTGGGRPTGYLDGSTVRPVNDVDLMLEGCLLEVDGQIVDSAAAAAVRLAGALVRAASAMELPAGAVLLSRALTEPVPVRQGNRIAAHFSTLGSLTIAVC